MTEEKEAKVRVGEVCSNCEDWLGESDEIEDLLCSSWKSSRVIIRQPCVVKKKISDCSISLFVCIIIWYPFGHKILKLDGATTHKIHNSESSRHHLGNRGYIIPCLIGHLHIMQLIGIAKISIIFSEDNMCLICDCNAPSGKGSLDHELLHERV